MKFTEQELKQLKSIQSKYNDYTLQLGQLELELIELKQRKQQIEELVLKLRTEEINLATELTKKYGKGTIDINTGEFVPQ
jgi:chromosome segregation ATPase